MPTHQPLLDDQTIESILVGRTPSGRPELHELAKFVSEVRSVAAGPAPELARDLANLLAGGPTSEDDDLRATASKVTGPPDQAAGTSKRRKLGKKAIVLAGLSLATTGAVAARVLPEVAQDRVAAVVKAVTPFDLPDGDDERQDGEHGENGDVAGNPEAPSDHANPNAENNFGSDVSDRAQTIQDAGYNLGSDFGQAVSADARTRFQPVDPGPPVPTTVAVPEGTPPVGDNPGTGPPKDPGSQKPAETPGRDNHPRSGPGP